MFQPVSFNKLFVQKQELPEKKGTEVSNRKVPNLADLPGLVAANVWSQLGSRKLSAAVFCHGQARNRLATQTWSCYQKGHKHSVVQSLRALFVQKYAVVCSKIRCCLFKNMFQNIGFKMFQTMCFFLCAQNVSPGIRSLFVEPVLKHDWANRLRRHPATSNVTDSTQTRSARKKTSKKSLEIANRWAKLSKQTMPNHKKISISPQWRLQKCWCKFKNNLLIITDIDVYKWAKYT